MFSTNALLTAVILFATTLSFAAVETEESGEVGEAGRGAVDPAELGLGDLGDLALDLDQLDVFDDLALLAAEDQVVSASRRLQRIEESPSAITVITREQIRASGYDNLLDLMRLVPGADVYRLTQGQGAVGLRTLSTIFGNRALVLVDGRDISLHFSGLPLWEATHFDLDSIERIEVIRGPGSTLYGANAMQGVVNIVTRRPSEGPFHAEVTAGMSGPLAASTDVRAHGRLGDFGYWGSMGWDRRSPYGAPEEVAAEFLRARLRLDWEGKNEVLAALDTGVVSGRSQLVTGIAEGPVDIFWPYLLGTLSIGRSEVLAVVDSGRMVFHPDFGLVMPDSEGGVPLATTGPLSLPSRSAGLTAHHTFEVFGTSLMVGGSARVLHHMAGGIISCPIVPAADFDPGDCEPADVVERRLGLFVQNEWYPREDLLVNLGCRLDHNSLTAQPGLAPRAAVVYAPRTGPAVRFSYGRAYRKPTFLDTDLATLVEIDPATPEDLGLRLQHLFGGMGTRDLVNEYVDSLEMGLRARLFDGRLTLTADTFLAWFRDTIRIEAHNMSLVPGFGGVPSIPEDAELRFVNEAEPILGYGGELQVSARPARWLELGASYSLDIMRVPETSTRDADGGEPDHRLTGSLRLTGWGMRAGADAFWFSRYHTAYQNPESMLLPSIEQEVGNVVLVNGQLSYRHRIGNQGSIEIGMAALNLLGQPYREHGGHDEDGRTIRGAELVGRRARIFVRGEF